MKSFLGTTACLILLAGMVGFALSPWGRALADWIREIAYWIQVSLAVVAGVGGMVLGIAMMFRDARKKRSAEAAKAPKA